MSEFSVVREKPLSGKNQIRQNLEHETHRKFGLRLQRFKLPRVITAKPAFSDVESIRRKA
jgi:hypothetical protein